MKATRVKKCPICGWNTLVHTFEWPGGPSDRCKVCDLQAEVALLRGEREQEAQRHTAEDETAIAEALRPFGWTCGPEFWDRYYRDRWVFSLANAVVALTRQVKDLGAALRRRDEP